MKTLKLTNEQIKSDAQIRAWQKVAEIAKKTNNKESEQFARGQSVLWQDSFFKDSGINVNWS
jgi:hypothetical protein